MQTPPALASARDLPTKQLPRSTSAGFSLNTAPPPLLILVSMTSVQIGAVLAKSLFQSVGPAGVVLLRVALGALILLVLWRPNLRGYTWRQYGWALLFGGTLAAMNFSFYEAIDRIPLGVAVTLEFVGPLAVALLGSRRLIDLLWVALAGGGIILLAPTGLLGGVQLNSIGVGLALFAGALWGSYILLSAKIGQSFSGIAGLALAMLFGAALLTPIGVINAGALLLNWHVLLVGLGVAALSSVLPYTVELEALRRLPPQIFGVLMSLEPGIAALVGLLFLREQVGVRAAVAISLVIIASLGATLKGKPRDDLQDQQSS